MTTMSREDRHVTPLALTWPDLRSMLRQSVLRPTRQRMALAEILFTHGKRHILAENLHREAIVQRVPVSLAAIYNTLNQFTEAGRLRKVAVDGSRTLSPFSGHW